MDWNSGLGLGRFITHLRSSGQLEHDLQPSENDVTVYDVWSLRFIRFIDWKRESMFICSDSQKERRQDLI
jgi:hypothetical protein